MTWAQKSLWKQPVVLLGDKSQGKLNSVHSEIELILMQDRCTVCSEHTTSSEIILDAPDGTPR
jgi:hypothetical protein